MQVAEDDEALAVIERLLRAHYDTGFRLAVALLRDRAEAEDAVQTASIRAWRALARSREVQAERAWFLGIVANECRSARRRRWWSVIRSGTLTTPAAAPITDGAADVRRVLARLPHAQRLALVLRYYLDLPYADIASIAGISEEAARARAHRALRALELQLRASEVTP